MKKIIAEQGGRPLTNDDLLIADQNTQIIQEMVQDAYRSAYERELLSTEPMIVSGVNMVDQNNGTYNITSGVILYSGFLFTFKGATNVALPTQFLPRVQNEERTYFDGVQRVAIENYEIERGIGPVRLSLSTPRYSDMLGFSGYDLVIRTQEQFDRMLASPTWLDAKSVALVGDGGGLKFNCTIGEANRDIVVPSNVQQLHGYKRSIINITETEGSFENGGLTTNYNVDFEGRNLIVASEGSYSFGRCINLIGCQNIANSSPTDGVSGFRNCHELVNCVGLAMSITNDYGVTSTASGFDSCLRMVNCVADGRDDRVTEVYKGAVNYGFKDCEQLSNCWAGGVFNSAFNDCFNIANCSAIGATCKWVFYSCKYTVNTIGTWSGDTSTRLNHRDA